MRQLSTTRRPTLLKMNPSRCLVLFTKPGVPGRVKTRLIGSLSAAQAAAIHNAFVGDLLERLQTAGFDLRVAWALDAGESLPTGHDGFAQLGDDLGERLHHGLACAGSEFEYVAAIGSDHPDLDLSTVERAFAWLGQGTDVVFGPASDGGYYLVACHRSQLDPEWFQGIEWSSENTLRQALDRCHCLGRETRLLGVGHDVDTPSDLVRLRERLEGTPATWCPRTKNVLQAFDATTS